MRSVPAGSYQRLSSYESLWSAWLRCRRHKRRQQRIAAFDLDADRHLCRLHRELRGARYRPSPYRLQVIHDPKTRLVAAPAILDRVVQNALLVEIGPTYECGFIDQSFACARGRGPLRAAMAYLGYLRRYRYRLALDISQYFASIDHQILLGLFAHRLRDRQTIALLSAMLASGGTVYSSPLARRLLGPARPDCGLPLGSYLSHWSGGLYLDGLDHHIKRGLKVTGYLRYMDDMTLFGDDPWQLRQLRSAVAAWLRQERRLALNPKHGEIVPCSQPATYLGYRISRSGILPGPKARRRLRQRLRSVAAQGPGRLERSLRSYRGLLLSP